MNINNYINKTILIYSENDLLDVVLILKHYMFHLGWRGDANLFVQEYWFYCQHNKQHICIDPRFNTIVFSYGPKNFIHRIIKYKKFVSGKKLIREYYGLD